MSRIRESQPAPSVSPRTRRIHAAEELVPPDVLARFESRLEELARERPELVEWIARMSARGAKP